LSIENIDSYGLKKEARRTEKDRFCVIPRLATRFGPRERKNRPEIRAADVSLKVVKRGHI